MDEDDNNRLIIQVYTPRAKLRRPGPKLVRPSWSPRKTGPTTQLEPKGNSRVKRLLI
ncbi:unnamed protein product [Dovyalis caffra]|uniref:Uncharacterized protein n=1 Tax=Dovyalis caffra TaxID=77055 RepID=A0AAV1QNT1_9ROSI|nr:unnamed protein product [Dovyalis caffra]